MLSKSYYPKYDRLHETDNSTHNELKNKTYKHSMNKDSLKLF